LHAATRSFWGGMQAAAWIPSVAAPEAESGRDSSREGHQFLPLLLVFTRICGLFVLNKSATGKASIGNLAVLGERL
jgi:hypothetical protein